MAKQLCNKCDMKFCISYFFVPFQAHVLLITADGKSSVVVNIDPPDETEKPKNGLPMLRYSQYFKYFSFYKSVVNLFSFYLFIFISCLLHL